MTWTKALNCSNNWYDPLGAWVQNSQMAKRWYVKYPLASRTTVIGANTVLGFIKPFLLPVIAAVGVIVQPIIATVQYCKGNSQEGAKWLKSSCFSLLALGGVAAFMVISAYHMTLMQGAAVVITGCALSIIIHVYRVSDTEKPVVVKSL